MRARLGEPVDAASIVAFRVLFGVSCLLAVVRFVAMGWVDSLLVAPTHHLHYAGFEWVGEPPRAVLCAVFAVLAIASIGVAVGFLYRFAAFVFFVGFVYVELLDRALYLNHYYALSLLALLLVFMPLGDVGSLDARRSTRPPKTTFPRVILVTLRLQLGLVYVFAGIAKLHPDWLFRAEPLRTWLLARADLPLLGPLFAHELTAYVMAWAGLLFDLLVPFALCLRRTRPYAYACVVGFHALTALLFRIGMFPWFMIAWTTIFFEPGWPRRFVPPPRGGSIAAPEPTAHTPLARPEAALLVAWFALQVAIPLRHFVMPGDVLWTYEGFDFAWHVMVAEKGAHADVVVVSPETGRRTFVAASEYYTPLQARMMSENPALIVQFAHLVARDEARRGHPHVRVYARSYASLHGRPVQALVDPSVDLTRVDAWTCASRYVVPLEDRRAWDGFRMDSRPVRAIPRTGRASPGRVR